MNKPKQVAAYDKFEITSDGCILHDDAYCNIVVSTVERFSPDAQELVAKVKKRGMTVDLVDKGIFNRMLDPVLPDRPWLDPISEVDEEISSYLADQIPTDNQLYLFEELNLFN